MKINITNYNSITYPISFTPTILHIDTNIYELIKCNKISTNAFMHYVETKD